MGQKKKVKLEDIAEQLNVSIVTVSNALKGKKGVSEEMRQKIVRTAEELGYRSVFREKKVQNSYIIGVAVAEKYVKEFPSFYMDIYQRIAAEAVKKGHLTVLEVVTPEKENLENSSECFVEKRTSGLILIGELKKKYIDAIRKNYDIPIVCVDYYDIYDNMDYIVTDGFGGMNSMTEYLLERGYKDLMFVGTPTATKNITDRYLGYCKALEQAGLKEAENRILPDRDLKNGDYHIKFDIPEQLPEAFVCNCDKTAGILIRKLNERGICVPDDVAVVGFDEYKAQLPEELKLTTYKNDEKVIAQISLNTLLRRIEGKEHARGVRVVEGGIAEGNTVKIKGDVM